MGQKMLIRQREIPEMEMHIDQSSMPSSAEKQFKYILNLKPMFVIWISVYFNS